MPLTDREIRKLCIACEDNGWVKPLMPMIEPFSEAVRGGGIISYGLAEVGMDIRLSGKEIWVLNPSFGEAVDPKRMKEEGYTDRIFSKHRDVADHQAITVPAGGYVLGSAHEKFNIPRWLSGEVGGKSTYARCGVSINVTTLEPGWQGELTVEIKNDGGLPVKLYVMEGIAKIRFFRNDGELGQDYSQKGGIYQGQEGVTAARVK